MKWTQSEKAKLIELVQQCQDHKRIQWQQVASLLENRTANQCKTMYTLVMKIESEGKVQKWTNSDITQLCALVVIYGNKWNFFQKNYFKNRSREQIRQRYLNLKKHFELLTLATKEIMENQVTMLSREKIEAYKQQIQQMLQFFKQLEEEKRQFYSGEIMLPKDPLIHQAYTKLLSRAQNEPALRTTFSLQSVISKLQQSEEIFK